MPELASPTLVAVTEPQRFSWRKHIQNPNSLASITTMHPSRAPGKRRRRLASPIACISTSHPHSLFRDAVMISLPVLIAFTIWVIPVALQSTYAKRSLPVDTYSALVNDSDWTMKQLI